MVRQYAYDRLADKQGVHTRLRDYFASVQMPEDETIHTEDDLAPVVELFHHTVRAGRYDNAYSMFRDRLSDSLYFRFGAYQTCIGLLRGLFPDGEDCPPRLASASDQAWTLNALANSYSLSGLPRYAASLFDMEEALQERIGPTKNLAIRLSNLADDQLELGELRAAENSLRRSLRLCRDYDDKMWESATRQELARLRACLGDFRGAAAELKVSTRYWQQTDGHQGLCVDEAYRALCELLAGRDESALYAARHARELADEVAHVTFPYERDYIRAEWLLGWSLVSLASGNQITQDKCFSEAETHLTEALTRCRRINLIELEPDILLTWARWHHARGDRNAARSDAEDALSIADRCEYRLCQADIHNFLARLDLEERNRDSAVRHAQTAYERAWCDGPPYCYKPSLDLAKRLLKELKAPIPNI